MRMKSGLNFSMHSELWLSGCLECGAMGDVSPEEIETACCYHCGLTNFMTDRQSDMTVEFLERFFKARVEKMS